MPMTLAGSVSGDTFLGAAAEIGDRLLSDAIWHGDRCTWVGSENDEGPHGEVVHSLVSLGPDLYGGSSGVGLFLAHLAVVTGDALTRRTARAAVLHALGHLGDLRPDAWAVYTGRGGVLISTALVGSAIGDNDLVERARSAAARCRPTPPTGGEFDLMSGFAGTVVSLLILAELFGEDALVDAAIPFGDALLQAAKRAGPASSWSSPRFRGAPSLAGLSHGAAGASSALLELYRVTKEDKYRSAAESGFEYERRLFDPTVQNWPDLRSRRAPRARRRPTFATYWCHGAPGIALSRLRAFELLGDDRYRFEAEMATTATFRMVAASISRGNYSLCHGLAGNAEILLESSRLLGASIAGAEAVAFAVAEAGVQRFGEGRRLWPCGTQLGETPNLFLGLSGIGYFYLRLSDPQIPSMLILRPEVMGRCLK